MIAAEAVLGERSFDLVGEPQWIVAVIFDPGHWVVPDAQWSFDRCRPRALVSLVTSRRRRGSALACPQHSPGPRDRSREWACYSWGDLVTDPQSVGFGSGTYPITPARGADAGRSLCLSSMGPNSQNWVPIPWLTGSLSWVVAGFDSHDMAVILGQNLVVVG
jgi:hypothetical protein